MTERGTPEDAAPRPVPDLGFFAAPSSSAFGAAPGSSSFGSAPSSQGFAPATAPANAFGTPLAFQLPTAPTAGATQRTVSPATKTVIGALVLLSLVLAGLGGRFGWRHFVAEPVLPETLLSMPRLDDPSFAAGLQAAKDSLGSELATGSEAKVAMYSDGQGLGYILFAVRGSGRPGDEDADALAGWTMSRQGAAECYQQPAQTAVGLGVTFCMRGFFRRAVIVMAIGTTPPDPATVARGTDEAWQAQ